MTNEIESGEVSRAADVVIETYGQDDLMNALAQARRIEEQAVGKAFATAVREEVERRCLLGGRGAQ